MDPRIVSPPAGDFRPDESRAGGQRRELLVAHVARAPAESAVRIQRELVGGTDLEDAANAARDVLRRVGGEALDVDDPRAELAAAAVFLPEIELAHLAAGELPHELIGAGLEGAWEIRRVRPIEARTAEPVAEADVEAEPGLDAVGRQVAEPRQLLARDVAARGLVELDPIGAGAYQRPQLLVDDLREALGHVDHAPVHRAGMDPGAERERAGARRLGGARRVRVQKFELLHDAE